jgi:hypothetical protein
MGTAVLFENRWIDVPAEDLETNLFGVRANLTTTHSNTLCTPSPAL